MQNEEMRTRWCALRTSVAKTHADRTTNCDHQCIFGISNTADNSLITITLHGTVETLGLCIQTTTLLHLDKLVTGNAKMLLGHTHS